MRKIIAIGLIACAAVFSNFVEPTFSQSILSVQKAEAAVHVKGYFRKNGTYVQPHYRSNPDGNPYNNWSFPGNTNPYTGKTATGNPSTYLKNYYKQSTTNSYALPAAVIPTYVPSTFSTYHSCFQYGMASWNSLSQKCECMNGYVAVNNYCESQLTYCMDKYGFGAEDAIGGGCQCSYGYRLNHAGTQCISRDSYCSEIDIMASWDYLNNTCTCPYGWNVIGNTCVPN